MLKALRNKRLMKTVMWSLVIIFALWGIGSVTMSGRSYAGSIFGKKISIQEYNKSYGAVLNRARIMYGDQLPKLEKFLNLRIQAWDRLILMHAASKKHLKASNKEVIQRIAEFPFFQRNGIFNSGLYQYITTSVFRTTPREFEESVRGDIIISKLMALVTKPVALTENEIKQAYIEANELADISFIILETDKYIDDIVIEGPDTRSFYDTNKDMFFSPAMANAVYIEFPFNEDKEDARFTADEILSKTKKGNGLDTVSVEYGLELKETGDFPLSADAIGPDIPYSLVIAASGLGQGKISDIIEDKDRFYILQVKTKAAPRQLSYEEAKDKVEYTLIKEKAYAVANETAENIVRLLQSGNNTLEDIASDLSHNVLKADNISRKSHVEGIGRSEEFLKAAFSADKGGAAGPVRIQNGFAVVRLDSITPIDNEVYQKDRVEFTKTLLQEKRDSAFQKWFVDMKEKSNLKDNL
jgi:hypothetical protein